MYFVTFLLICYVRLLYCQINRNAPVDFIRENVESVLMAPQSLEHMYGAAIAATSVTDTDFVCNCPSLRLLLKQPIDSLDIYYGLKTSQMCNCATKLNDRFYMLLKEELDVIYVFSYHILHISGVTTFCTIACFHLYQHKHLCTYIVQCAT